MYISKERLYIWFSGGPLRILFEFKTNYSANSNVKEIQCLHSLFFKQGFSELLFQ